MKLSEFKRLFSFYLPDRVSDAYLEKMFKAICYNTVNKDTITFKVSILNPSFKNHTFIFQDLIETLALLHSNDPKINAEWTFRLINPKSYDKITFNVNYSIIIKNYFFALGIPRIR